MRPDAPETSGFGYTGCVRRRQFRNRLEATVNSFLSAADDVEASLFLREAAESLYIIGASRFVSTQDTSFGVHDVLHPLEPGYPCPQRPPSSGDAHDAPKLVDPYAERITHDGGALSLWDLSNVPETRTFQKADGSHVPLPGYGLYHFTVAKRIPINPHSPTRRSWPDRPPHYIPLKASNALLRNDFNFWLDINLGGHCLWRHLPKILKQQKRMLVGITQYIPLPGCHDHPYRWSTVSQWAINVGMWDGTLRFSDLSPDQADLSDPPIVQCTNGVTFLASDIAKLYTVDFTISCKLAIPDAPLWRPWRDIVGRYEDPDEDKVPISATYNNDVQYFEDENSQDDDWNSPQDDAFDEGYQARPLLSVHYSSTCPTGTAFGKPPSIRTSAHIS
ncbi:hypothetical protein DACRYDRAFT_117346 [Dacryopinax primogenitus]|uniref:Uncharacterized protein n=1 Tax=Dacryopinax primogenitus (strain DJM 731) TaxID=1858805 RepID=M5FVK6_DACPD|nr:uncharacterized protein DACRYDRAFT_117346 [Dacryopinax primogenitus]EJU00339.1 hypothetical protein DACRYDRAFT_117346 [Dacryopinax primogenitus]